MKAVWRVLLGLCVLILAVGCGQMAGIGSGTNYNLSVSENESRALSASSANGPATRAVIEEFSIGVAREDVFDTLGTPDWIFYGDQRFDTSVLDADAYHVYSDVGLSFRIFGDSVREITLLSDAWVASNGLVVGMSRDHMLEILGPEDRRNESTNKDFYTYDDYDIMVEVYHETDSVGEINIREGNLQ